jgi:hypothetical protein
VKNMERQKNPRGPSSSTVGFKKKKTGTVRKSSVRFYYIFIV